MSTIEPWFSIEDVSIHLHVSKKTFYRWLEKSKIPAHHVKKWRFKASDVDEWVKAGNASDTQALAHE